MQDRFKFRFWDKEKNVMIYSKNGYYKGDCFNLPLADMFINSRFISMQCTGLKDKNKKLIYEGDIIKIPDDYATYGQFACEKREVYWNEGFRLKPKWDTRARGNWLEDTKDLEVIGNIYENADLLQE